MAKQSILWGPRAKSLVRNPRIYVAGPDVFSPNWERFKQEVRRYCHDVWLEPVFPDSKPKDSPAKIYRANISRIWRSNAVMANLQCFRGSEPDSGTVFEVGYAIACGKPVWGHSASGRYRDKVAHHVGLMSTSDGGMACREGFAIEAFGEPVNLMLAVPVHLVPTWQDALDEISEALHLAESTHPLVRLASTARKS